MKKWQGEAAGKLNNDGAALSTKPWYNLVIATSLGSHTIKLYYTFIRVKILRLTESCPLKSTKIYLVI